MKPIQFEINEKPYISTKDFDGDFNFYVCATNQVDDDFSEVIDTLGKIWDLDSDVSLKIKIKLKDVYEELFNTYEIKGGVRVEDIAMFDALRKDCQWIVDQINALELHG